ncbi:3701_t:CDS:1 [Ambispora leptoticha]|uniref:3701_t:CDS:1 n=1 Tax=Ambispora leptoticha TaxID=144679 RepID=A0A9N9BV21_9GLOM|nr:3701_t:CDS:1 [Ambispora leptoticha]
MDFSWIVDTKMKATKVQNQNIKSEINATTQASLSTKTTISSLPTDCFDKILSFIHDRHILFSAALVDRTWCRLVIPKLWKSTSYNICDAKKGISISETYIKCMNDEERQELINSGITAVESYPRALFPYASFIKRLDLSELEQVVSWFTAEEDGNRDDPAILTSPIWKIILKECEDDDEPKMLERIMTQIHKLIFRSTKNLEYIRFCGEDSYSLPNIAEFPNVKEAMLNLQEIMFSCATSDRNCNYVVIGNLINVLKSCCRGIEVLQVDLGFIRNRARKDLCELIEAQNGLKHVLFYGFDDEERTLINALSSQKNSLVYLEFVGYYFSGWLIKLLENLGLFTKLEGLTFTQQFEISNDEYNNERFSTLVETPKCLRNLYFSDYMLNFNNSTMFDNIFLFPLLKICGPALKELTLKRSYGKGLFDVISEYAKTLEILELNLEVSHLSCFLHILSALEKLEHLCIADFKKGRVDISYFWVELGKRVSINLQTLYFNAITSEELDLVLSSLVNPIKELGLGRSDEMHLRVIRKFCKRRQVRIKLCVCFPPFVSNKNLLEEIKEWVEIVNIEEGFYGRNKKYMGTH